MTQLRAAAVGMPAAAITSLANDFDPSIIAAAASGPKQAMPFPAEGVGHASHQRRLRADDDQVGGQPERRAR